MTIDDRIKDEKLQYDINREAAKISALSSGKIRKYQYLIGEDILPCNQQQILEQAKFTYSPLGKAFEQQIKTIKDQGEKQVEALINLNADSNKLAIKGENIIPKSAFGNDEAKDKFNKIKKLENIVDREKLVFDTDKYKYDFREFKTIRTFGKDIYDGKITLKEADEEQSYLTNEIEKFTKETNPKNVYKKQERKFVMKNLRNFLNAREMVLNGFKSKIVLTKSIGTGILNSYSSKLQTLTPKQMLPRLPIALAQVQAGNNLQNLLNEIRQIVYLLYQSKVIKKSIQ